MAFNSLQYVGPYTQSAYDAANKIYKTGSGTPYSPDVLSSANKIISSQLGNVLGSQYQQPVYDASKYYTNTGGTGPGPSSDDLQQSAEDAAKEREENEMSEVDSIFNPLMETLDKIKSGLQGGYDDFLNSYSKPFEAQIPLIQQAGEQGLSKIGQAKEKVNSGMTNALNAASQQYNELQMRNNQLFGGAALSSAGQASGEILGREQMRNTGNIRQSATTAMADLETEARNLQANVTSQVNNLTMLKDKAISDAKIAFDDRMREIELQKGQLESNKSYEKLNTLRNFNATITAIDDKFTTFKQNLLQQAQEASQAIQSAYGEAVNASSQASQYGSDVYGGAQGAYDANMFNYGAASTGGTGMSSTLGGKVKTKNYTDYLNIPSNYS